MSFDTEYPTIKYLEDLIISPLENAWFLLESKETKSHYLFNNESCELGKLPAQSAEDLSNIIKKVIDRKIVTPKPFISPRVILGTKKTPRLMLFLTADCNLSCVYCHCNSGDRKANMDEATAIDVVRKYLKHVSDISESPDKIEITFMGGGEPFLRINTIKAIVQYIDDLGIGIKGEYVIVTNGTVGTIEDWEWLISNGFRITISADGPPLIQNQQRKSISEKIRSSDFIERRLGFLGQSGATVHIRSTVMDGSKKNIVSICNYFEQFSCVKTHHLEPVSFAGRATSADIDEAQFYSDFFKNYAPYLYMNPNRYKSAWFRPFKKSDGFCGSVYYNITVTHDGYVSLCSEVDSAMLSSTYGKNYIVSHIDGNNPFLSKKALEFSDKNRVENIDLCKNCIIRYKCSGGCYIKRDRDFSNNKSFYDAYCKNTIILNMSYLIRTYESSTQGQYLHT